ncbi:MAG: hypothetical protein RLZZ399_93 [Verrucomicrobiota bacterium]|jgi:hypothetical protein
MAEIDSRKAALIAEIEVSRSEIRSAARRFREAANVVERTRSHIGKNFGSWLVGSAFGGFLISQVFRITKRPSKSAAPHAGGAQGTGWAGSGMVLAVLKLALDLARPSLMQWVSSRIAPELDPSDTGPRS